MTSRKTRPGKKAGKEASKEAKEETPSLVDYHSGEDPPWQALVKRVEETGVKGLLDEYKDLKKEKYPGRTTKAFEANPTKNRYLDVGCWDQSRVVLSGPGLDYIHGNWVDGAMKPRQFIATQGPIEDVPGQFDCTMPEFWRMIWEHKCSLIVMLCQTVEMGKAKCAQYWPENLGEKVTWGEVTLETTDVGQRNVLDHTISMTTIKVSVKEKSRNVVHFLHQSWPDRKCPPSAYPIVEFLIRVHSVQKTICMKNGMSPDKSPMVVHCSAGIGRSGTFLAVDIALNLLSKHGSLNIKNLVRLMRSQRHFAVQTPVQYLCIYQAILEFLVKHKGSKFDTAKFAKEVANIK